MDECLTELCVTNTTDESRSSWHYAYAEQHPPHSQGRWAIVVGRHRRNGQRTVLAVYPDQEVAEAFAAMLSAGGHWFQTGGSFHKSPRTTH